MIEKIENSGVLIALVIRSNFEKEGIHFFTENKEIIQFGYMKRAAGYKIQPHIHKPYSRLTDGTQEVLFLKKGKVRVNFFDEKQNSLSSTVLNTGDWIVLLLQGHGFDFIEESELFEVKNGPYASDDDKVKF